MVGKRETVLKLSYLQSDKKHDGRSANICLRIMLLVITTGWIGQVNFGTEVNCNNFTKYVQNKKFFKLFKH